MRHRRVVHPSPLAGQWRIGCQCGFEATTPTDRHRNRQEAERELDRLFVEHIRPEERRVYVLVDQREGEVVENARGEPEVAPVGNFIMPEGVPCRILTWWQKGGFYRASVSEFVPGAQPIDLPVGEIRLADGRVFRIE